jgi:DNA-binding NarL/FixJ family response regulator
MVSSAPRHQDAVRQRSTGGEVILIADDDEFFRVALRTILTMTFDGAQVVETASLDEAVECLSETSSVTLALFDLNMPGMESAASLRAVRECFPDVKVAMVSASRRRNDILLALEAGAHGYIPKVLGAIEMAAAIKAVLSGAIYVPASLTDLSGTEGEPNRPLIASAAAILPAPASPLASELGLTPRQHDVLKHLVQGKSNREIARALNLGEGTVKVHMAALFRVLGVTSRSAAAAAGFRLLEPRTGQH